MTLYVAVDVDVSGFNAIHNQLLEADYPALTALYGLGHALFDRALCRAKPGTDISALPALDPQEAPPAALTGLGLMVVQSQRLDGAPKMAIEKKDAPKMTPVMVDQREGSGHFVLLFRLEGADVEHLRTESLKKAFAGAAFAGGRITKIYKILKTTDPDTWCTYFRTILPGKVLIDRRDLLGAKDGAQDGLAGEDPPGANGGQESSGDPLEHLLDCLDFVLRPDEDPDDALEDAPDSAPDETGTAKRWRWRRRVPGWLVPVACGWRLMEPLRPRITPRASGESVPHAYATGLLGLGEFLSAPVLFRRESDPLARANSLFWQPVWRGPDLWHLQGPVLTIADDILEEQEDEEEQEGRFSLGRSLDEGAYEGD